MYYVTNVRTEYPKVSLASSIDVLEIEAMFIKVDLVTFVRLSRSEYPNPVAYLSSFLETATVKPVN